MAAASFLRFALSLLLGAALLSGCGTKQNTAASRFWQKFNTKYNVYFNGHQAYKEGMQAKEKGAQDNYMERLPLFMVGNAKNAELGKGNFETCIEKMQKAVTLHSIKKKPALSGGKSLTPEEKLFRQRKEFNPQLKKAWMLMGQAQFQKGEFEEAAATFSYICRLYQAEPPVVAEARTWLARCYAQINWFYDAEDVLSRQKRDSLPPRLLPERDATMADLLLRQNRLEEALPYLASTISHTKGSARRARLYFLQGQIQHALGMDDAAYKSLGKCASHSPVYQLKFNARILQTEVLGQDRAKAKQMIGRLKRMTRNASNKDYLDQVYYAMGNIHLAQADTAAAIAAYEKGRKEATRSGVEKGALLLRLGEVYWAQRRFDLAQPCYSECISLLGKEHARYKEVMKRSKVLDELVPYTSAVYLQDSLQALARMPEAERMAAIDRVIEALKQKEAEERKLRRDSAAQARAEANRQEYGQDDMGSRPQTPQMTTGDRSWYFYNVQLVSQGKQDFRKTWGKRKNEDDWRRTNHTVVAQPEPDDETPDTAQGESTDSLATAEGELPADTTQVAEADSTALDPHNREYYLAQIPFTEEQMAASHDIIKDGLFNAGVIEKDKLEDFPLAAETLTRLITDYPDATQLEDALYHMFLLYSRWGKTDEARLWRNRLAEAFPESPRTRMITDPDFELLARYGMEMEDSLYTETYRAYRDRQSRVVNANYDTSTRRFPEGLNRPKFIFIHALNGLGTLPTDSILAELKDLLKQYPKADVAEMAGMIVNGLESGRTIGDGRYDLGSLWNRRTADAADGAAAELKGKTLTAERDVPFTVVIAYPTDSIDNDKLLYEVAHFNFTAFRFRGFDMSFESDKALTQFRLSGFRSYDEALAYTRKAHEEPQLAAFMKKGRVVLIADENLPLLGVVTTFDEYQTFFDTNYAPLRLPDNIRSLLEEPEINTRYEDEAAPSTEPADDDTLPLDDDASVIEETVIPVEEPALPAEEPIIPAEEPVPAEEETPVPVQQEEAPAEEDLPVVEQEEAPAEEALPVVEEDEAPAEEDLPVVEKDEAPAEEDLPVVEEDEAPAEEDLPVVEEEEAPAEEDLPVVEEEEAPAEEDLPVVEEKE